MPERRAKKSKRLTVAGLIAVSAATLLMMVWAVFPTAAFATVTWTGNGTHIVDGHRVLNTVDCDEGNTPYLFWVFTGDPAQGQTAVHLTVNGGAPITMVQQGQGAWQATSGFSNLDTLTASVDGVGGNLTLSHGCPGETTTTTETETTTTETETTTTETETTTTETETTSTETTETETTSSSTTPPSSSTTPPSSSTTPPSSTTETTPTSVSGTSVTPPGSSSTPPEGTSVLPTTVTPGGTAFTGIENVVPLGAIALMLMTGGSGLMWAGSRRRRKDKDED
jgi:hypothetical protein